MPDPEDRVVLDTSLNDARGPAEVLVNRVVGLEGLLARAHESHAQTVCIALAAAEAEVVLLLCNELLADGDLFHQATL